MQRLAARAAKADELFQASFAALEEARAVVASGLKRRADRLDEALCAVEALNQEAKSAHSLDHLEKLGEKLSTVVAE